MKLNGYSVADITFYRRGVYGIPIIGTCIVCGRGFPQPAMGRPRKLCGKAKCWRQRHRELQASYKVDQAALDARIAAALGRASE